MKVPGDTYHYGDLDKELLQAALQHARKYGPDSLSLRALARQIGVSPTAPYRHYKNQADLFTAIKHVAAEQLADFIQQYLKGVPDLQAEQAHAVASMHAVCEAYVLFALEEPGLFRTANSPVAGHAIELDDLQQNPPFTLFREAFDSLVRADYISTEAQPAAEITLWATAHGLASLLLDSPLQQLSLREKKIVLSQTITSALRGIRSLAD